MNFVEGNVDVGDIWVSLNEVKQMAHPNVRDLVPTQIQLQKCDFLQELNEELQERVIESAVVDRYLRNLVFPHQNLPQLQDHLFIQVHVLNLHHAFLAPLHLIQYFLHSFFVLLQIVLHGLLLHGLGSRSGPHVSEIQVSAGIPPRLQFIRSEGVPPLFRRSALGQVVWLDYSGIVWRFVEGLVD